jgi:hypothetical protein
MICHDAHKRERRRGDLRRPKAFGFGLVDLNAAEH